MPLVAMRELLDRAAVAGRAVGAFNVNNLEQVQAVFAAAADTGADVIVAASSDALDYAGDRALVAIVQAVAAEHPGVDAALHLDHGETPAACAHAVELGFTSVMMDGSLLPDGVTPAPYDHNLRVTGEVVELARSRGVTVEGELGTLGGVEEGRGAAAALTDPEQAAGFVARTGVDALAVSVGTSHGAYKFPTGAAARLDLDRLAAIHRLLPDTHLVLHGASLVPAGLVELVEAGGGRVGGAVGVPEADLRAAIGHGVRKVNTDTDIRLAFTGAARRALADGPEEIDPRWFIGAGRDAMRELVAARMRLLLDG